MTSDDADRDTGLPPEQETEEDSAPQSLQTRGAASPPARRATTIPWGVLGLGVGAVLAYAYARAAGYG